MRRARPGSRGPGTPGCSRAISSRTFSLVERGHHPGELRHWQRQRSAGRGSSGRRSREPTPGRSRTGSWGALMRGCSVAERTPAADVASIRSNGGHRVVDRRAGGDRCHRSLGPARPAGSRPGVGCADVRVPVAALVVVTSTRSVWGSTKLAAGWFLPDRPDEPLVFITTSRPGHVAGECRRTGHAACTDSSMPGCSTADAVVVTGSAAVWCSRSCIAPGCSSRDRSARRRFSRDQRGSSRRGDDHRRVDVAEDADLPGCVRDFSMRRTHGEGVAVGLHDYLAVRRDDRHSCGPWRWPANGFAQDALAGLERRV